MTSRRHHPSRSSRTIWRLLEDAGSHEFNGQSGCRSLLPLLLLSGWLWAGLSPRSCHLARNRDGTVPTAAAGKEMWAAAQEKDLGWVKGVLMKHFRGRQKVSDVPKFSQALYLFPPLFCPIHKLEQLQPFTALQKDLTKRHPLKKKKKKLPYGQIECKLLHTVKTTLFFKRKKKKQPHQSAWLTCAFRWTGGEVRLSHTCALPRLPGKSESARRAEENQYVGL